MPSKTAWTGWKAAPMITSSNRLPLPSWWRARPQARAVREVQDAPTGGLATAPGRLALEPGAVHPPREGL